MNIEWSSLRSYGDVVTAIRGAGPLEPQQFIDGPLNRLFELARDEEQAVPVRARTLEFARHFVDEVSARADSRGAARKFKDAVQERLMICFGPAGGNLSWAIDVFEGRMTHHTVRR